MPFITANAMMGYPIASTGQIVLLNGVTVSADGNAINGNPGTSGSSLLLMGHVLSANTAGVASASNNYKVLISSTGVVSGGTDGILLSEINNLNNPKDAGGNFVENWGMVVGASGIGIRTQYSNNYISNLGTVNAIRGIVAGEGDVDGLHEFSGNTVVNSGKIFSVDVGVTLYGSGSSLTNSGLIRTNSFTFAVELQGGPGGTITVHNTGTIESSGATAVHGGSEDDRLTNTGTIIGGIDLGDGSNLYDGRGGTVAGDILLGAGNDTAYGGAEGEGFFGDAGNDLMDGGAGNDTFTIDVADPSAAGGEDTALGGAGDDIFNLAGGISPKTILNGGDGVDRLELQFGAVMPAPETNSNAVIDLRLTGLQKVGGYWGSLQLSGIETVASLDGNDLLIGSSGGNTLTASAGSDTLEGGLGNDVLDGGTGTDFVRFTGSTGAKVKLADPAVIPAAQATGYGSDTLIDIEGLIGGSGADSFTGNALDNTLIGNAGNDTLSGGDGLDTLSGGLGNDKLTGGAKADTFVFDTKLNAKTNVDAISGFSSVEDDIHLSKAIFGKLTASNNVLASKHLRIGAAAKDKDDYLVYDKATGALSYDADGSGSGVAVKFAQLAKNASLAHHDFIVY